MPTLTGLRLTEVRFALAALKDRRLPSLDADLLVARLFADLKSAGQQYDAVAKKLQQRLDAATEDADRAAVLRDFALLQEQTFEVPPFRHLTPEHLPLVLTGEREMNSAGNAGIMMALGDEYFYLSDGAVPPQE
jgi:CRP-like cAMP-binding protein